MSADARTVRASKQHERILDATYACFRLHGMKRTTMEDIAREAGLSRNAVYQYVRSKDDAFQQLAARLFNGVLVKAHAGLENSADLTDQLAAILTAKVNLTLQLCHDSAHAAELLTESGVFGELEANLIADIRELVFDSISAHRPAADAAELTELLMALARGFEVDIAAEPETITRRLRLGVTLLSQA